MGTENAHPGPSYRSASARARAFDDAVAEAMGASVTDALNTQSPSASDPAAGTPSPEGVAPYNVAREHIIPKPTPYPDDSDRVQHSDLPRDGAPLGVAATREERDTRGENFAPNDWHRPDDANALRAEHERQARLRRWQAVDPRERKA